MAVSWRLSCSHCVTSQRTLLFSFCLAICQAQKATKNVLITADDEKLRDPEGYAAIVELHRLMDDDKSGSIDRFESNDFIKEDMQFGESDRAKREKAFHHNSDEQITVNDLWEAWFQADERSWKTAELVNWLEKTVKLPQYSGIFVTEQVDGRALPRMAVTNSTFLIGNLGIKNPVHRRKIQLKALDVVLFGFSGDSSSRMKDIALSILLILLITVLVIFKRQRSRSNMEMEKLSAKLSQLKTMESDFEDVQQRFEEERKKRQSVSDAIIAESEQMETLRSQLIEAERLLESSSSAPLALQPLLRRTCELEMSYVSQQRLECIAEMRDAIELIDKLRKKQSSIISSIKLATGASTGTDQVDSRIFSLKARMEKISVAMGECQQRWVEIESLCGFPLMVQPNGAELTLHGAQAPAPSHVAHASSSSFYRTSGASSSTSGTSTNSGSSTVMGSSPNSVGTTLRGVSARAVPSSITSHHGYSQSQQHISAAGGIHSLAKQHIHSSAEDLHLRSLAALHRQQHHKMSISHSPESNGTASTAFYLPQHPTHTDPALQFEQEMKSRLSASSLCSTDSNEDEKESGNSRSTMASKRHEHSSKMSKFAFFRKAKFS